MKNPDKCFIPGMKSRKSYVSKFINTIFISKLIGDESDHSYKYISL